MCPSGARVDIPLSLLPHAEHHKKLVRAERRQRNSRETPFFLSFLVLYSYVSFLTLFSKKKERARKKQSWTLYIVRKDHLVRFLITKYRTLFSLLSGEKKSFLASSPSFHSSLHCFLLYLGRRTTSMKNIKPVTDAKLNKNRVYVFFLWRQSFNYRNDSFLCYYF